ncbi:MAG: peptidase M3 [Flavobacteriales bacterium]|nr:peptidase M3 [Flavobacteriales bacterium]|tara:strand:+ start:1954 stop:3981 length:2028 start_codon:yes stop_codon:yes gene_type:complete
MNPLIEFPKTPFESLDFNKIKPEHFMPSVLHWMDVSRKRIDVISTNSELPSFKNTLIELEFSTEELNIVSGCFFNLNSAETNDDIQKIARELSPKLSLFHNEILLNQKLFERIKEVWNKRNDLELSSEEHRLLKESYEGFVRNGALLQGEQREQLKVYSEKLSKLSLSFGENVLKETQDFEYHAANTEQLEGLSAATVEAAKSLAQERNKEGFVFGLDMPTYMSIMKYSNSSKFREHFYRAYSTRAAKDNEFNNEENIKGLVNTRHSKAQLLGFNSHAELTLHKRMAKTPHTVLSFLNDLKELAKPAAQKDLKEVQTFAAEHGHQGDVMAWDFSYWSEKLKKAKLELDDTLLKPYFMIENVLSGVFEISRKLYGLSFKKNVEIAVYHSDVDVYEVYDSNGDFLSLLYTDFFPREGKRAGAWMTSYRSMSAKETKVIRPHVSIVCNFTKPTVDKPSLLTFNEVTTLFHEFGHALHGMMARGTYPSLTGTNVYWDFVELPSQILENWCYEPKALELFAKHYETGEVLPKEYIDRIVESQQFMEGYMTLRQLNFGYLDMAYHNLNSPLESSIAEFEKYATSDTQLFEPLEGSISSTAFSHIFQGGYSAGYYSYKWAEVLDADAFELFKEKGIFNKEVASRFAEILSRGGTEAPDQLYKKFRNRNPSVEALLKRAGIAS